MSDTHGFGHPGIGKSVTLHTGGPGGGKATHLAELAAKQAAQTASANRYVRREDVEEMLRVKMSECEAKVAKLAAEVAGTGDAEVGLLRKQHLGAQIAATVSQFEALLTGMRGLDECKQYTYRSFTQYDGTTKYNALVDVEADRVPLDPVVLPDPKPETIGYTLTVTRKADGEKRTRTGEMKADAEGIRELWWEFAEGSMGSDCNHDILFGLEMADDDGLVDEPKVSAYTMDLKLDDGTVIDLNSLVGNLTLAVRLDA